MEYSLFWPPVVYLIVTENKYLSIKLIVLLAIAIEFNPYPIFAPHP
jgi:hypothetical protein